MTNPKKLLFGVVVAFIACIAAALLFVAFQPYSGRALWKVWYLSWRYRTGGDVKLGEYKFHAPEGWILSKREEHSLIFSTMPQADFGIVVLSRNGDCRLRLHSATLGVFTPADLPVNILGQKSSCVQSQPPQASSGTTQNLVEIRCAQTDPNSAMTGCFLGSPERVPGFVSMLNSGTFQSSR